MLLQEGKIILGIAMLTAAYEKTNVKNKNWTHLLQEQAFSLCNKFERCTAMPLVSDILKNNSFLISDCNIFYILSSDIKRYLFMSKFIVEIAFCYNIMVNDLGS